MNLSTMLARGALLGAAGLLAATLAGADPAAAGVTANPPAAATVKPLTAQQERMKSCNADAGAQHLAGAARQGYMKACLGGKTAAPAASTPQERMKACNAEAGGKGLKGTDRRTFMSACLKAG
ncbi:MAG: PsiF family protein [Steroidobacteraceae bacterium]